MRGVFLFVLVVCALSNHLLGQSISRDEARGIASKVLTEKLGKSSITEPDKAKGTAHTPVEEEQQAMYFFNETDGGFVIISGDKRNYPVLAYSTESTIPEDRNDWPPSFSGWVEMLELYIDSLQNEGSAPSSEMQELWAQVESGAPVFSQNTASNTPLTSSVTPLLSTTWNQGCGYNALCPTDSAGPCRKVYTGCVATAMAQVMRYMEHPTTGIGSHCYNTSRYGQLCADFSDGIYDYSAMTNTSGNSHVAKLMYHCGVSVNMGYSPSGSGAYSSSVVRAWQSHFDYKNSVLIYKNNYDESDWIEILKNEINNMRPLYYAGYSSSSGHAFVLDGYDTDNRFHVNWGWGGSANGYFHVAAMGNYSRSQQAIAGAIPGPLFTNLDFSELDSLECATPKSVDISTGKDYINHYKNTYPTAVGKELVFTFANDLPGRIRIKISNNTGGDVNVFLLSHPHQDSLIAYGTNDLVLDDMEASRYYISLEGVNKKEPTFDIEVICPSLDADIIFTSAHVSPEFIESNQNNVVFTSILKNIGNTDAPSCSIEYFLSEDQELDSLDILLGSDIVPAIQASEDIKIISSLSMPDGLIPGHYSIIFVADRENLVVESDDDNFAIGWVQVPDSGIMNCDGAIEITDGVWHNGNTQTEGTSDIDEYRNAQDMTGPEIIHTFTPMFNGFAKVSFIEKHPGNIRAMVLPICNENTYFADVWFNSNTDTIGYTDMYVTKDTRYYIVVDGHKGASGEYALKVDLPKECPEIEIEISGGTKLCEGDYYPSMWAQWGSSNYQWFNNGEAIPGETGSWFSPSSAGSFHVEISENGCTGISESIHVEMSPRPDTAMISNSGDLEFCPGGSVELMLDNTVTSPINWAINNEAIEGATSNTYTATQTGTYTLITTNGVCSIHSENNIDVKTKTAPADIGQQLALPSSEVKFHYTFNENNTDQSGNNYYFYCNDFQPVNDRFDNFWQARYFTNDDVTAYVSNRHELPNEFTLSLWFKTSSNSGGVLAGFTDSPWNATQMEAMLFMADNGKIHFYMSDDGIPAELVSSEAYNNGLWHCVSIRYNGNMKMSINGGAESLENLNTVAKQNLLGYWVFAGPKLPANVSDMPSSEYFDGAIDDIICVYETNNYLDKYNFSQAQLNVQLNTEEGICTNALVEIEIFNAEPNTLYRIWNESASEWYSEGVMGNFGNITIIGNYEIENTTVFKIQAVNTLSDCEIYLDTLLHAIPITKISQQPASQNICIGDSFTLSAKALGNNLSYQWKQGAENVGENSNKLTVLNAQTSNLGDYTLTVNGTCGTEVSEIASIDFSPVWAINTQPNNSSYCEGDESTQSWVLNNEAECFNALENITVAGNGRTFTAGPGSWVTFIAGTSIRFLPGFTANAGSYVNAYITTEGIFCDDIMPQSIVANTTPIEKSIETEIEEIYLQENKNENQQIKVYPNPNNGSFTVQLSNFDTKSTVSVFNISGKVVYQTKMNENTSTEINLPHLPGGIYYLRANDSKTVKTTKMIVR